MAEAPPNIDPLPELGGRRVEQALAAVRAAIADGRMRPGVRYSVYQLAESLRVSRTPVREALLRLEEVGLITFEARQGFHIRLPRAGDIAEIFAVRLALELPAVRRAAAIGDPELARALRAERGRMRAAAGRADEDAFMRHDQRLHDVILEWAGNQRARAIVAGLRETTRLLGASTAERARTITDIDDEHAPIVDAIVAGDANAAEAAMRRHLVNTGRLLVAQALRDERNGIDSDINSENVEEIWSAALG